MPGGSALLGEGLPRARRRHHSLVGAAPLPSPAATRSPTAPPTLPGPLRQYKTYKVVYRRYAGLYFVFCVDATDNELLYLETIHLFVEVRRAAAGGGPAGEGRGRLAGCLEWP